MKNLKISLIQPLVTPDNKKNIIHIEKLIEKASQQNSSIVCLPERWYHLEFLKTPFPEIIQEERGIQYQLVKQWAKKYGISIISGASWEKRNGRDLPFICSYYFNKDGKELFRQDKIHLYSLEKEVLEPGKSLQIFKDTQLGITFSILICFDLNVSSTLVELAVSHGAEMIFSPTLIRNSGMENWKIYLQARALENRIPIASCNSIFNYMNRNFIGKSKIIHFKEGSSSPVQLIIDEASKEPCVFTREIDLSFPNKIRKERNQEKIELKKIRVVENSF